MMNETIIASKQKHIAIFGATGYIGTKIIIELYNRGHHMTVFARNTRKLSYINEDCGLLENANTRICISDIELERKEYENIKKLLENVDAVYYLVHSLNIEKGSFLNKDNDLAELIAGAAEEAGVKQIIYLGGLGIDTLRKPLSEHLKSRQETADYLRHRHKHVTEFRAGVIIGEGSASFELIRALAEKLPFIPVLGKDEGLCQPIFVNDVVDYLLHALLNPLYYGKIAEIGCDEQVHYSEMVKRYSKIELNQNLALIPIPLASVWLTPQVISWFASRMSGMPYILIYRLIEGAYCDAVIGEYDVKKIDPNNPIKPTPLNDAIAIAAKRCEQEYVNSSWSTPYEMSVFNKAIIKQFPFVTSREKHGLIFDEYSKKISMQEVEHVFDNIKNIGRKNKYYSTHWLWQVRGFIDQMMGGPGLNKWARRSPKLMRVGDRIDFWVVTYYVNRPNLKVLRLKANMKTPGTAWLQFSIERIDGGDEALLTLRPYFDPDGIFGYVYWYSLYFIHKIIFNQMINNLTK